MIESPPWSRPNVHGLREILEEIVQVDLSNLRESERLELNIPAEILTAQGNAIPSMTRDISFTGIGLLHCDPIDLGNVTVHLASDSYQCCFQMAIEWCSPCENGMFKSGGRILSESNPPNQLDKLDK